MVITISVFIGQSDKSGLPRKEVLVTKGKGRDVKVQGLRQTFGSRRQGQVIILKGPKNSIT